MRLSLLVGTDSQVHGVEGKGLLVQDGQFAGAGVFPASHIGEVLVVALGFTVGQLVLKTEVSAPISAVAGRARSRMP